MRHFGGISEAQSQQLAPECVGSATMRLCNKWLHNVDGLPISPDHLHDERSVSD